MPYYRNLGAPYERTYDEANILVEEIQERIEHIYDSVTAFLNQIPDDLNRINRLNETLYNLSEELDEEIQELSSWGE